LFLLEELFLNIRKYNVENEKLNFRECIDAELREQKIKIFKIFLFLFNFTDPFMLDEKKMIDLHIMNIHFVVKMIFNS
jgi:hypothetical protein